MRPSRSALFLAIAAAAAFCPAAHSGGGFSSVDSLYYFYTRTLYLENLFQEGAWWANPARISSIDKTSVFTTNTGLLGGKYALSSVRLLFKIKPAINAGFGVTGAGTTERRSFTGTSGSGAHYSSNFTFNRPSLEAAVSYTPPLFGSVGALFVTGTESDVAGYSPQTRETFFFFGINPGYSTPLFFDRFALSFSALSVYHNQFDAWWDHCAKAGVFFTLPDSTAVASIEYGFSLDGTILLFEDDTRRYGYDALKTCLSIRFRRIAGLLVGYSNDYTRSSRDNGPTFHGGVELRRSDMYPYFGGYEAGLSFFTNRNDALSLIHRIWIGYSLEKNAFRNP